MNELELIEKKNLRDEYINRIDILEKVKQLLLLPDINLATTQQVADFYEVSPRWIKELLETNRDELVSDGYKVWKADDFIREEKFTNKQIAVNRGSFEIEFSNGEKEKFAPRGVALFTRRAILRIGMLLRDSEIAKEVRTQLLNIEEKSTVSQRIESITEEQELVLKIIYAKDDIERATATGKLLSFKNRQIDSLENKVEALVEGNLTWEPREAVNRMVRLIAYYKFNNRFGKAWDRICGEMLYAHNIGITRRKIESELKNPTIFDVITDDEMKLLVQSCVSLCEKYQININDLMIKNVG